MLMSVSTPIRFLLFAVLATGCIAEEGDEEWQNDEKSDGVSRICPTFTPGYSPYNGCEMDGVGYYPGAVVMSSKHDRLVSCESYGGDPRLNSLSTYNWKLAKDHQDKGCSPPEFADNCYPGSYQGCNYPMQGYEPTIVRVGCTAYGMVCESGSHFWGSTQY